MPTPHPPTYTQWTDEDLIDLYRKEQHADIVEELHRRYQHLIFGSCIKYLKDSNRSEDLAMEIMGKVLIRLRSNIPIENFSPWLYGMVRNECITYLRKQKKQQQLAEKHQLWKKSQSEFMENDGFLRLYNRTDTPQRETLVNQALKDLSAEQRRCLELFYYQDKSYKEIEQATGYDLKKVKSALQNGKRNLKKQLTQLFAENGLLILWACIMTYEIFI